MPKPTAKPLTHLDGAALLAMFNAAFAHLESQVEAVNALNVYPVPDGDTGTNMHLTLRAALEEAAKAPSPKACDVASAMAKGSLMGARGNSGVILSQILRGFSKSVQGKERLSSKDVAAGLEQGSQQAYAVVTNPVEGTILTVVREAAAMAKAVADKEETTPSSLLEATVTTAKATVARTPFMLEILRENGVVDAGGQGLALILEGALHYVNGTTAPIVAKKSTAEPVKKPSEAAKRASEFGYCTEFLVEACTAPVDDVRQRMLGWGDSVIVVGDGGLIKVHLHTKEPDQVERYLSSVSTIAKKKIDDIDAQHMDYTARKVARQQGQVGVVAVVSGQGLANIFTSLGVTAIIPGGQTMNPSAQDILKAVDECGQESIIVLPNNSNVIPAAKQAAAMKSQKKIHVLPTVDMPQGVAAMLAYNFEAGLEQNKDSMTKALTAIRTGEVTTAVRDAVLGRSNVKRGQMIALADGKLAAATDAVDEAVLKLLMGLKVNKDSSAVLYAGASITKKDAEELSAKLKNAFPEAKIDIVAGGQPHYHYLLGVE